jgi:hypothetical protein
MDIILIITGVVLILLLGACVYALIDFFNQINNIK